MAHSLNSHTSQRSINISGLRMFADNASHHSDSSNEHRSALKDDYWTDDNDFPLLVDSGLFELPEAACPYTLFDIDSVVASKETLGSLTIDGHGRWCYSVYNIKMQFLKPGEKKMEHFSLYTEQGQLLTVFLTLVGTDSGAAVKKVFTEATGFES
ncbi:VCBS domain-containing protein [Vibrio hepatarius]|uniref:VCBS domain-containing protein n=1 Tax=Vibrio hepatarius TaxID=171383 RepID=UPI001C08CE88|nr:VCBS domain-containing protein [Vibrio hepatarius]MBU2899296.1 VCBS domain-containing protein [Vibrio hepatarius]